MQTATDTTANQAYTPSANAARASARRIDRSTRAMPRRRRHARPALKWGLAAMSRGVRDDVSGVLLPWLAVSVSSAVFLFAVALARTVWRGMHAMPDLGLAGQSDTPRSPTMMTRGPQATPACRDG